MGTTVHTRWPQRRVAPARVRRALVAVLTLTVALISIPGVAGAHTASPPVTPSGRVVAPGLTHFVEPSVTSGGLDAASLSVASMATAPPNTAFALNFDASVDAATRTVVQAAAGTWSAVLTVDVPITVDVSMSPLSPGMLGAAGPTTAYFGQPSFPQADVLYPVALANQFAGRDLDPTSSDIDLVLSSSLQWDKRVDGSVAPSGQSMLSVAIHELGHGLGHTSWVHQTASGWSADYVVQGVTVALAYDRLVGAADGTRITALSGAALDAALRSPLYWYGSRARTTNGGTRPRLYSPSGFELGSSVGHLDEATFGSGLMTPFLSKGEVHTAIPALTTAMLADTGWILHPPASAPADAGATTRARTFVDSVAHDFLGRGATVAELTKWGDFLVGGGDREKVTLAYAYSDEWIGVIVDQLYRSTLGRAPDPAGRAYWISVIKSGRSPAAVAADFYASDEYFRRAGGTTRGWILDLYAEILGRGADPGGLAYWVGQTAVVPRSQITYGFYQSLESRRARVESLYRTLLGRAPESGGWSYWADILTNGRDIELATFLAASDEYWNRATRG